MPAFRKKPVIVEAVQATEKIILASDVTGHPYEIEVRPGEWIVTGVQGELYPCRDDIFRETFEPVGKEGVWALLKRKEEVEETPEDRAYIIPFPGLNDEPKQ